ncbi:MAG: diacylglycerol kinase family lipid kinase [Clostridiales bacterium]|nr:diacylglycerol kinase family lipid kinase [Clostridiales bacterium]
MEKLYFIVNPVSGGGRGKSAFLEAEKLMKEKGVPYEAVYSEWPGHAVTLAKEAAERGESCIVAVGGDGTVNEVASAVCGRGIRMGVLPFGTGNDLARVAPFPMDVGAAVDTLIAGYTRPMDAGMANDRFFLNVAGFGFDADVLQNTTRFKGRFRGMIPYLLGIAATLSRLRHMKLTFTHDGKTESRTGVLVSVGNGQYFGGGMRALPTADLYDGLFDVIVINDLALPRLVSLLPRFIKGKHMDHPAVEHIRTAEFTVTCEEPSTLNLDGELGGSTPVTFRILPGAIPMIVPEEI